MPLPKRKVSGSDYLVNKCTIETNGQSLFQTFNGQRIRQFENPKCRNSLIPKLIAWDCLSNPLFRMEVSLTDIAPGKTKFGFRTIFSTAEECNRIKSFVADKKEENFDRLERELKIMF